ncbi:MAG: hypothetical protein J0I63_14975 [Thiobacillus sp.]|nr:hypothetical protein [Thiobacillus sp.]
MSDRADDQLALSAGLTTRTAALCLGLESGVAEIFDLVTPTTAELLKWWFGDDVVAARGGLNFHAGQKQAILNAIVAHEVQILSEDGHRHRQDLGVAGAADLAGAQQDRRAE